MTQGDLFDGGPEKVFKAEMPELIRNSKKRCPTCGNNRPLQSQSMDKSKVRTMMDMAILHREGQEWVRVEEGHTLVGQTTEPKPRRRTAYCASKHILRVSYMGLAEQFAFRVADWKLLPLGYEFLKGAIALPEVVLSMGRTVYYESIEEVFISQVRGLVRDKDYWDHYPWSDFA